MGPKTGSHSLFCFIFIISSAFGVVGNLLLLLLAEICYKYQSSTGLCWKYAPKPSRKRFWKHQRRNTKLYETIDEYGSISRP